MFTVRDALVGVVLSAALVGGGAATVPAVNGASGGGPELVPARDTVITPRLDSLRDICAGLYDRSKGKNQSAQYKKCAVDLANQHKPTAAELKCYRGAAIAMGAILADHYISKSEAKTLAARLLAAGAFGCIGALWV